MVFGKSDLVNHIAMNASLTKEQTQKVAEVMITGITDLLKSDEEVHFNDKVNKKNTAAFTQNKVSVADKVDEDVINHKKPSSCQAVMEFDINENSWWLCCKESNKESSKK